MTKVSRLKKRATLLGCLAAVPLAVVGNALYAEDASAAFKLRLTPTGGTAVTVEDGDDGSEDGIIAFTAIGLGSFGNFSLIVNTGTSKPHTGTATSPELTITSLETTSGGSGELKIELTDTGFSPTSTLTPFKTTVANAVSSSFATLDFKSYIGVGEFDKDTLLSEFPGLTGTFSHEGTKTEAAPDSYSLTLEAVLTHSGGGTTSGFNGSVQQVPEPFTIMGAAVALGFGAYSKRKFKTLE